MLLLKDNVGGPLKMPTKLKDTSEKVGKTKQHIKFNLLLEFYGFLRAARNSEKVYNIVNPRK
jgi:hypothetical protein